MEIFQSELSSDFAVWKNLPDYHRLERIVGWRKVGARAASVYSAEQFPLYQRFGIGLAEWSEVCGAPDFEAFESFRTLREWGSPRSLAVERPRAEGRKLVKKLRTQLENRGIVARRVDDRASLASDVVFEIGELLAVKSCTFSPDGVRMTVAFTRRDPDRAFFSHDFSHSLMFIDTAGLLSEEELSAVEFDIRRSVSLLRARVEAQHDGG